MEKKILEILEKINISDLLPKTLKGNLIELHAVSKIIVKEQSAIFAIDIGILGIDTKKAQILEERCKKEIMCCINLQSINIVLTADKSSKTNSQTTNTKKLSYDQLQPDKIDGVTNVIAIASGKGGVGKSTIAVNLAVSLTRIGFKVGIVDADIYGPSIPHMMNLKGKPKIKDNMMIPLSKYGIDSISIGLMFDKNQSLVWRGPMVTKTLYQLIRGVKWHDIDYLIVDLPPGTGDAHLSMAQKFPISGVIIVSTPQEIAVIDAVKSVDMFQKLEVPILGVIQNMSYLIDDKTGKKNYLFGKDGAKKMAKKMKINFLGDIALDIKIREAGDNKNPIANLKPSSQIAFEYGKIAENIVGLLTANSTN